VSERGRGWRRIWSSGRAKLTSGFGGDVTALGISGAITAALNLLQTMAVARMLGPDRYGIAVLVMSYPSLLLSFADARASEVSMRYLGEFARTGQTKRALAVCRLGYLLDAGITLAGVGAVIATAGWAERSIVKTPNVAPLILIYAISLVPQSLAGTSYAVLSTLDRIRLGAVLTIMSTAGRVVAVVGLVWGGWDVSGVILGNAVGLALQGLALAVAASLVMRKHWGGSWFGGSLADLSGLRRQMVRFLGFNNVRTLIGLFSKQGDVILVGLMRGPHEAGLYRVAKSIGSGVAYIRSPLQQSAYPRIVRACYSPDNGQLVDLLRRLTAKVALPATGLVALGIPLVPFVVDTAVGPSFHAAALAGQIFLLAALFSVALFWLQALYLSKDGVAIWTAANAISALGALAVGCLMLWAFGFMGLVVATSLADVLLIVGLFARARRLYLRPTTATGQPVL
jgi:O-antigen/teichoic acid export membrane protein